jgi:hypothetical protein
MQRRWPRTIGIGSCGILALGVLVHVAFAAQQTPITVAFGEAYPLGGGDQIGSDNGTTYVNGGAVETVFDASGDLHFYTDQNGRSGGRSIALAFQDCFEGCGNTPFTSATLRTAFMSTNGVNVNGVGAVAGLKGMPWPSSGHANLNVNINGWFIRFNPSTYPGSQEVDVTRNDEHTWTITACSQSAPGGCTEYAGLISLSNGGKTETNEGLFYMPTTIKITCPSC